ncbi:putative oxidoreductase [Chitinophaga skermanii]|uniref:Putative oxidoreductase n=1 Tax=Chitinophaga skermanii TaxID=331697 RepID=A0A327QYM8_9BACT|nr:SDR family NAD(P)-dependent oxidoreductase [Chitinophaga skermanii]RAJ08868.1 putative oxidoreductase [Chitinophaga skermanii]
MNTNNKTILITGGGSGIGFEIAKLFSAQGNKVIIAGRSEQRLQAAVTALPGGSYIVADITNHADVDKLVADIKTHHSDLSILINNAGAAFKYDLNASTDAYGMALAEFQANLLAPIHLTEQLLPLLKQQPEAAIVNVSSIVAFAPSKNLPTYAASKSALHSYTQALRLALADTNVKVFELMPPLVNTDFSEMIGGKEHGMPAIDVAKGLLEGLKNDTEEMHIGQTAEFRKFFFASPEEAVIAFNKGR